MATLNNAVVAIYKSRAEAETASVQEAPRARDIISRVNPDGLEEHQPCANRSSLVATSLGGQDKRHSRVTPYSVHALTWITLSKLKDKHLILPAFVIFEHCNAAIKTRAEMRMAA